MFDWKGEVRERIGGSMGFIGVCESEGECVGCSSKGVWKKACG